MSTFVSFGKYELVSRLARGGMAETYRAQLRGAAGVTKQVVIKKVLPDYADDKGFIEAFIDEAKVSASLSHGNIAQVFDFGEVDGDYFIAMELVDGRSLVEVIYRAAEKGFPTLPIPIACFITMEVLKGLHYAHTKVGDDGRPLQIVHRDISPENVLVAFDGSPKVVDFGVAKAALQGRRETEPGKVKGKFQYLSPEQARGEPLDGRSDVFAVGIILYRMLCGVMPFEGQMHVVMRNIADGNFQAPQVANAALPPTLAAVISKSMATDRKDRYANALQMQEALARILFRDEPTFSSESVKEWMAWLFRQELEADGRASAPSKRFQSQLAKWDPHGPKHATSQAIRKVKPAPRSRTPVWFAGGALLLAALVGGALLLRPVKTETVVKAMVDPDVGVFPAPMRVDAVRHRLKLRPKAPDAVVPAELTGPVYEPEPRITDAPLFAVATSTASDGQVGVVYRKGAEHLPRFSALRFFDFQPFEDDLGADHPRAVSINGATTLVGSLGAAVRATAFAQVTGVKGATVRLLLKAEHPDAWVTRPRKASVLVAWTRAPDTKVLDERWKLGPTRAVLADGAPIVVKGADRFAFAVLDPLASDPAVDSAIVSFETVEETDLRPPTLLADGKAVNEPLTDDVVPEVEVPDAPPADLPLNATAEKHRALAREVLSKDPQKAAARARACLAAQSDNYECSRMLSIALFHLHDAAGSREALLDFLKRAPPEHPWRPTAEVLTKVLKR